MNRFFKVIALVAVALSSITFTANAQLIPGLMYGPTAGANLSTFKVTDEGGNTLSGTSDFGYQAGAMVGLDLPIIELSAEVLWVHNKMSFNDYDASVVANNIEVPILVSLPILGPLRLKVGPSLNVPITNRVKYDDGYDKIEAKSSVGYVAGLGLNLFGLTFDVRYNSQFNKQTWDSDIDQSIGTSFKSKFSSYSASVGYRF